MSFLEHDWAFTDNENSTAPHRLVLKGSGPTGEIEVEKNLSYDLQVLPELIRSEGDISFSKHHSSKRTLADLEKVSASGKVSFYCPAITTTQNYEFGNIGHLALYVDGLFTTHHSFIAPALTLEIDGPLACGVSNDVMGTIAATKGSLTVKAHSIDGRFGKFYGKGATSLKATQENLTCGSSIERPCDTAKRLGCTYQYTTVVGNKWAYTTVSDVNGAYIATDSTLDLKGNSLTLNYGQIFSHGAATFVADNNISAIRSIVKGNKTAHWRAKNIHFGRADVVYLCIGWMSVKYTCVYGYAAKSDQSEVHFGDSIWFDTADLKITASTISSKNNIYLLFNGQHRDLTDVSNRPPLSKDGKLWLDARL